jgi:SAM-dependent methyltransferase
VNSLTEEYLRLGPLQTRIETHRRYSETVDDVELKVIQAAKLEQNDDLLDVGCGTGSFLRRLRDESHAGRLAALDASPAAVAAAAEVAGVAAYLGDAADLPFHAGEFDVVTARHMLYHVDDPGAAIGEARRVLRAGGRFVSVVNHPNTTPKIARVVHELAIAHGCRPPVLPTSLVHSDNLPDLVRQAFGGVEVYRSDNALVFKEPHPLIQFGLALMNFYGVSDDNKQREAVAQDIVSTINQWFATHDYPWRDPKGYVTCVATNQH